VEVEQRHEIERAGPVMDGGTVPVFSRIGVRDSGGERFARRQWKHQADPNTKQNSNNERFHFFLLGCPSQPFGM